jgi:putative transposase
MSRSARIKSRSGIYHVMLRGANKQEIFHDDGDNNTFLNIVEKYKMISDMNLYAWCLMNNHVHLLLKEGSEELSITMKRIGVSYVSYYNWKYRTTGHLFQDRFKSENVETERYFLTVLRYIHQNPVKAGIVQAVDEWRWSSCPEYYGKNIDSRKLVDIDFPLNLFSDNRTVANERFQKFNEEANEDRCLDETNQRRRLRDEEARLVIKELLGVMEIAQVKSLPKVKRNAVLREIKRIHGLSQRQAARILGISENLIFKA